MTLLLCSALLFSACAAAPESASEPSQDKPGKAGESGAAQEKQEPVVRVLDDGKVHVIRIQDGGRVIVLPEGGAEIEGKGAIRLEDGGKRIRFDGDVSTLVDGEVVEESEAKPGQKVEVRDGSGKTLWVLRPRAPKDAAQRRLATGAAGANGARFRWPPAQSEIVTDGARTYWLDAVRSGDAYSAEPAKGKYSVIATDGRGSFRVEVENGEVVAAEVDGKSVPLDSIEREGSRVRIPGQGGTGDLELTLQPSGGLHWKARGAPQGYLGVQTTRPDDALAEHLGLRAGEVELVSSVFEGSPAERSGLEPHDIITHVDGQSPITTKRLAELVRGKKPGEKVTVRVLRKGQPVELSIALGERKGDDAAAFDAGARDADALRELGVKSYSGKELQRWQDYVKTWQDYAHALPNGAYALGTGAGQVEDIVKRLEEQHQRLEEQLERLEQQQRELQALEERLQKLGQKGQGGR